jgi:hypothetical protein
MTKTIPALLALLGAVLPALAIGCSAAPEASTSASQAVAAGTGTDGAPCDPSDTSVSACAPLFYCAPSSTAAACGSLGTCTASPGACPLIDNPVCGCDGQRYYNGCFAEIGNPNEPGTTTSFLLDVPPTVALVAGTWSRVSITGSERVSETLVLNPDMTYSLTEETGCAPAPHRLCWESIIVASSAGTYALGFTGPILTATSGEGAGKLATEFTLQNDCPGQGLVLQGNEPQGTGPAIYLTRADGGSPVP